MSIKEEIKDEALQVESWFKKELKEHWGRIALCLIGVTILVTAYVDLRDDVKSFFTKDNKTVVQVAPTPVNINADGKQISQLPPTYVNVNPVVTERTTATLTQNPLTTHPTVKVTDPEPKFTLNYNGHKFDYVPYTTEQYNFDEKKWTFDYTRKTEMNVNVEVPTPRWSMGIGKSFKGSYAVTGDYRLGTSPFQVWGYASDKDQAIGLKFTQYSTTDKGVKK